MAEEDKSYNKKMKKRESRECCLITVPSFRHCLKTTMSKTVKHKQDVVNSVCHPRTKSSVLLISHPLAKKTRNTIPGNCLLILTWFDLMATLLLSVFFHDLLSVVCLSLCPLLSSLQSDQIILTTHGFTDFEGRNGSNFKIKVRHEWNSRDIYIYM